MMDLNIAKNLIKNKFNNFKKLPHSSINIFLNDNIQLKIFLQDYFQKHTNYESIYKLIFCLLNNIELTHCKICNKQLTYRKTLNNSKYCSIKCFSKDNEINQLRQKHKQQTNIKKYGTTQIFANKDFQQKINQIKQQKYGTKIVSKNDTIKNKISNKVKSYFQINGFTSIKESFNKKYGYNNPLQVPQIKKKIIQNNIQKYSVKYPKLKQSYQNILKWHNYILPLFQLKDYQGYNKEYQWKCVKCENIFKSKIYSTSFFKEFQRMPRCKNCYPLHQHFSKKEKELVNFCKEFYPNLIQNNRSLIKPYELDIVIPQIKLAIEFNGLYWHSTDILPLGFHLMKTQMCQKIGYRLIHIWQHQWNNNCLEIKQKLQKIFVKNEKIDYINNIKFDRCWYKLNQINNLKLIIEKPEIINIGKYQYQNCGYFRYQ